MMGLVSYNYLTSFYESYLQLICVSHASIAGARYNLVMKTIIFDLSDVLVKGLEGVESSLATYLKVPIEQVFNQLFKFDYREFWLSQISEDELFARLIAKYEWNISPKKLRTIVYANFREISGTRKLISELKLSYTLILLSVNPREWAEYFEEKFNYENLFDYVHYSYEIGYTKREPQSFLFILEKYQLDPKDVLLIDDSTRNINVARSVGIDGIKFISATQMRNELQLRELI